MTAENSEITATKAPGRPFQPGQSGNPGGRKRLPEEFKQLARSNSELALKAVIEIVKNPKSKDSDKIRAAEIIMDRGWGKPVQGFDIGVRNDTENPVIEIILNDPELSQFYQDLYRKAIEKGNNGLTDRREIEAEATIEA